MKTSPNESKRERKEIITLHITSNKITISILNCCIIQCNVRAYKCSRHSLFWCWVCSISSFSNLLSKNICLLYPKKTLLKLWDWTEALYVHTQRKLCNIWYLCKLHRCSFPVHLCVFNQCREGAMKGLLIRTGGQTSKTDKQGRVWCCCVVLRPGLETADWCKTETRGWNSQRVGREGVTESWSETDGKREREGESDGAQERRVGRREEGRRDIIEPVWVSRLTELQGAAPAQRCYCKFPSLYRIHPEVLLILSNIMSTTLELC